MHNLLSSGQVMQFHLLNFEALLEHIAVVLVSFAAPVWAQY